MYTPSENLEQVMTVEDQVKAQRHKLRRQFARVEKGHKRSQGDSSPEHINYDSM